MKLAVLTAAVFPTEADARQKMWIFLESAKKAGVPNEDLYLYGVGRRFPGYRAMCLDYQLEHLKVLDGYVDGYSHVLFTDGWDAFFTGPLDEIIRKYEKLGSPPILCSAFYQLANCSDAEKDYPGCFDHSIYYRYPNRGGYIAELPAITDAFERMAQYETGDDCFCWYNGIRDGWFKPVLDTQCDIFQVSSDHCEAMISDSGEVRLWNTNSATRPCILHLSGGYTDQVTGKDDRMIPWARKLRIIK